MYLLDGYILKDIAVPDKAQPMSTICESQRREKLPCRWHTSVFTASRGLKQKDHKFQPNLAT